MTLHASQGACWPWWCKDLNEYRYDVLIELIDENGDAINEDYESYNDENMAEDRIEYINDCWFADWDEYDADCSRKETICSVDY